MGNFKNNLMKQKNQKQQQLSSKVVSSTILDKMVDGREFESLVLTQFQNVNVAEEIRKSIKEVEEIRKIPLVCYVANVVKQTTGSISIDTSDDLPFNEMLNCIDNSIKEIDIVLVTPGGFANQAAQFVNSLRPRFDKVNFLLLNKAMSAGTIFVMSGDEIIMTKQSQIGPIDPQVRNRIGAFIPAQSILTLIEDIKTKGEAAAKEGKPVDWTDLQILRNIDPNDIATAISASQYSIGLVQEYLYNYKFKNWENHSTTANAVTDEEKKERAKEIAQLLCNHSEWKNHGHAITREAAWQVCKLKIKHAEDIDGLERAMRRMWALFYWLFENTGFTKVFASNNYLIIRSDVQIAQNK